MQRYNQSTHISGENERKPANMQKLFRGLNREKKLSMLTPFDEYGEALGIAADVAL